MSARGRDVTQSGGPIFSSDESALEEVHGVKGREQVFVAEAEVLVSLDRPLAGEIEREEPPDHGSIASRFVHLSPAVCSRRVSHLLVAT